MHISLSFFTNCCIHILSSWAASMFNKVSVGEQWETQSPKFQTKLIHSWITSVCEIHSVDCCWMTKIDCPPWIGFMSRVWTPRFSVLQKTRLTTTVIGKIGSIAGIGVRVQTALISRFVQCCVVRQQCRASYRHCKQCSITFATVSVKHDSVDWLVSRDGCVGLGN